MCAHDAGMLVHNTQLRQCNIRVNQLGLKQSKVNKEKLTTWKAAIQFSRIMMCLCSSEMSK